MDKMRTSKDSTTTAGASANDHHNQQEAMGAAAMQEARNKRQARLPRPQLEEALMCPRCGSSNTKFCYYNNNNMSQPRYRCKNCVRNWTQGGTLRNVPVGGGGRKKNKRSLSQSASSSSISKEHLVPASSSMTMEQDLLMPAVAFELPRSQQPLSFPGFGLAHPTGAETSSFLDMLTGDFDYQQISQGFYEPVSSGMEAPPLVFGGAPVTVSGGEGATAAATQQGAQWPASQVGANDEKEGASVPDNARG